MIALTSNLASTPPSGLSASLHFMAFSGNCTYSQQQRHFLTLLGSLRLILSCFIGAHLLLSVGAKLFSFVSRQWKFPQLPEFGTQYESISMPPGLLPHFPHRGPQPLKEQYPVTAHVPNFDFLTGCCKFKRCEESQRTLKNPFHCAWSSLILP